MPRPLYVAFTMDCERIASESPPGGPATWELSERSICGYVDTLTAHGAKPTLFLVPECAERHAALFRDCANRGVEIGLHTHPQSFLDHQYTKYLAEYDLDVQRELISQGKTVVEGAVGITPTAYRAGNLAGNADTFTALVETGFDVSSNSSPGRDVAAFSAHWLGADPDPHWASNTDYMSPGDLPLLEIPLTTDPVTRQPDGDSRDVRIERGTFAEWHRPALENTLERMDRVGTELRAICILTHNFVDYSDQTGQHMTTLKKMLAYLTALPEYEIIPTTLSSIRESYVAAHGLPKSATT